MDPSNKPSQKPLRTLTAKELAFMEYLEDFMANRAYSPSFKEIKEHFGFASYNSVQRYLKQLQFKGYVHCPGGNQKRAISLLLPSNAAQMALHQELRNKHNNSAVSNPRPPREVPRGEVFSLPLLGKVAAGFPIEELSFDESVDIPSAMVRKPEHTFTLQVKGESMVDDGILDGDILVIQEQDTAKNSDIVVATVDNEATVKRFYLHNSPSMATPQIELRPSNPDMNSMWYSPEQVSIRGIVIGLLRKF